MIDPRGQGSGIDSSVVGKHVPMKEIDRDRLGKAVGVELGLAGCGETCIDEHNEVFALALFLEPCVDFVSRQAREFCQQTDPVIGGGKNAGLLLYKATALRKLGVLAAARDTLTATLRRKKGRSGELLRSLRYERALVYQQLGWTKRYRKALEELYAESPDFEDLEERLGLR